MRKLLIVENAATTTLGLKDIYDDRFDIRFVSTYMEAKSILEEWQPDLAIIDVYMPLKDSHEDDILGFKIAKDIKSINRDIGIVMYSAHNDLGKYFYDIVHRKAYRGFAYVLKGSRLEILNDALENVSRLRNYTDSNIRLNRIPVESYLSALTEDELEIVLNSAELIKYLSSRELEVLDLITSCYSNKQIARTLCIEENTVETHVTNLYNSLSINKNDLNPRLLVSKAFMLYKIRNLS